MAPATDHTIEPDVADERNLKPGTKVPRTGSYTCIYCGPEGLGASHLRTAAKTLGISFSLPPHLRMAPPRQGFKEGDIFPSCPNCQRDPSGVDPTGWALLHDSAEFHRPARTEGGSSVPRTGGLVPSGPRLKAPGDAGEWPEVKQGLHASLVVAFAGAAAGALLGVVVGFLIPAFGNPSLGARMLFWTCLSAAIGSLLGVVLGVCAVRRLFRWAIFDNALVGAAASTLPLAFIVAIRRWNLGQWDEGAGTVFTSVAGLGMAVVVVLGLIEGRFHFTGKADSFWAWGVGIGVGLLAYGGIFMTAFFPAYGPLVIAIGAFVGVIGIFACRQANPNTDPIYVNEHPVGKWLEFWDVVRVKPSPGQEAPIDATSRREPASMAPHPEPAAEKSAPAGPGKKHSTAEILALARGSSARTKPSGLVTCDKCGASNRSSGAPHERVLHFSLYRCDACSKSFCAACVGLIEANMPCPHCNRVARYPAEDYDYV